VAVIIDDGVAAFELAIPCEVFGIDRVAEGLPAFEFSVCSLTPGPVRTSHGFHLIASHDMAPVETADLVIVPPCGLDYVPPAEIVAALHRAVDRGARVASLCSGAFTLARAGLLEGRRSTTHWFYEAAFRAEFPEIECLADVLYVEDGPVISSAGTAAGIDLCLHLIRQAYGAEAANGIARRMVFQPQRDGGQAQFVRTPLREQTAHPLAPVLDWAGANLNGDLSIAKLAARAAMSQRTFARRFREETGTTPHQWVLRQRIALAEQLLETGGISMEQVAQRSGFGSAAMLRHHFGRRRRTTPVAYRRIFGPRPQSDEHVQI